MVEQIDGVPPREALLKPVRAMMTMLGAAAHRAKEHPVRSRSTHTDRPEVITVFTLCSTNYLAHAKTLGDSLRQHNPDYHFVIGLVDRVPADIPPSFWQPYELIPVEDVGIDGLRRHDRTLRRRGAQHGGQALLHRLPLPARSVRRSSDLSRSGHRGLRQPGAACRYARDHSIVVTPHSCTYDDSDTAIYYEQGMLSSRRVQPRLSCNQPIARTPARLLQWWQHRLKEHCYYAPGTGIFVDQLWMTLAPLYFDVYVEKNPGYNMCYWNHFERTIEPGRWPLHRQWRARSCVLSFQQLQSPTGLTASRHARSPGPRRLPSAPISKPLYDDYRRRLMANGFDSVKSLKYSLRRYPPKASSRSSVRR